MRQQELYNYVLRYGRKLDLVGDHYWSWLEFISTGRVREGEALYVILSPDQYEEKPREVVGPIDNQEALVNFRATKAVWRNYEMYSCVPPPFELLV